MNETITLKEPLTGLLPHQRQGVRTGFTWTQTFTGKQFWPADPRPEDIDIIDIAHALSMLCRFNGHCSRFYSVAEHSINVSRIVEPEHARWALLHDVAEAYIGDLPSPVKRLVPDFKRIEEGIMKAVAERFNLHWPCPDAVKRADGTMLATELEMLIGKQISPWESMPPPLPKGSLHLLFRGWFRPESVEEEFLERFNELF